MAKTIYDYWFTQFDFPDADGKPYRSSGGKMVWNDTLKCEIPFGWEVRKIKDICAVTWGQCPEGKHILPLYADGIDYCSGAGDMKGGFLVDCQAKTDDSQRSAHKNDILISVAGKIGDICVVDHDISLGRAAAAFSPTDEENVMFIFCLLQNFNRKLTTISSGSIQKVINNDHIDELLLAYNEQAIRDFGEIALPIYRKLTELSHENRELTKLRDWLLPMLMNGQATIAD